MVHATVNGECSSPVVPFQNYFFYLTDKTQFSVWHSALQTCLGISNDSGGLVPVKGLTKFLRALALAGQLPHLYQSIEIAFGSEGDT